MKYAYTYKRVSTEEQGDYGFSLPDQDSRLNEYCQKNGIILKGTFQDDFSGKTFDRPGFKKLMLAQKKDPANLILFTKWSRFSRNTSDSYRVINEIKSLGADVQAIDEPIDFSIPQNKILLGVYLALPEVDNDIRTDATIRGTRQAMKQGRYVNMAPYGYKNKRDESGKPIIVIDPERAGHISEMFAMAADGKSQQEIRTKVGFSKSQVSIRLQNPIYCGLIAVPAYKSEPAQVVTGIHQPIISEELFYRVQEVVSGRRRTKVPRYKKVKEDFPLSGFLFCGDETEAHKMTCSCSKGRSDTYHYYHCANALHHKRWPAEKVNDSFLADVLSGIQVSESRKELWQMYLEEEMKPEKNKVKSLQDKLVAVENRIRITQDKYVDSHISFADYQEMRGRYELEKHDLKEKIGLLIYRGKEDDQSLDDATKLLDDLAGYYQDASPEFKRDLLMSLLDNGSTSYERVWFDGKKCRTTGFNPAVSLLCKSSNTFNVAKTLAKEIILPIVPNCTRDGTLSRTGSIIHLPEPEVIRLGIIRLSKTFKMLRA